MLEDESEDEHQEVIKVDLAETDPSLMVSMIMAEHEYGEHDCSCGGPYLMVGTNTAAHGHS
jgi:hypothetical protein